MRGTGKAELSNQPICESFFRVLRFHLGTLAFGALLITIVRVIRGTLKYLEKKTKAKANPVLKCIFNCVGCCLKCCECILNRISKEGFIFCSIYGTAFCYSSFHAITLLLKNAIKSVMVSAISHYTEIFGRLAIAALNTGIAIIIMTYISYFKDNLSSNLFPAIIIFILSLIIASHFMQVFEVAVDAIFLSFLIDEAVHGKPRFASKKIQELAGRTHEYAETDKDHDDKKEPLLNP